MTHYFQTNQQDFHVHLLLILTYVIFLFWSYEIEN